MEVHLCRKCMRTSLCGVDIESQTSLGSTENGSELTALCAPEAYTGSKFSKICFGALAYRMDCSCAPMFRFFSVAPGGAITAPKLESRFRSLSYQFEDG